MTSWIGKVFVLVCVLAATSAACSSGDMGSVCAGGDDVSASGTTACVYRGELIEEGFQCPSEAPFAFPAEGGTVCGSEEELPQEVMDELDERGIEPAQDSEGWQLNENPDNNGGATDAGGPGNNGGATDVGGPGNNGGATDAGGPLDIGAATDGGIAGGPFQIALGNACPGSDGFDYDTQYVLLSGDTLTVGVGYSGGCETHEFIACWNEGFAESDPVQANVNLIHTTESGNPDPCEAYAMGEVEIDISSMRTTYESAYQTNTGTIIVHVDGYQRADVGTVNYSF